MRPGLGTPASVAPSRIQHLLLQASLRFGFILAAVGDEISLNRSVHIHAFPIAASPVS